MIRNQLGASYSGEFIGHLLGHGLMEMSAATALLRSGMDMFRPDLHVTFARGFKRGMVQAGQPATTAEALLDMIEGEKI